MSQYTEILPDGTRRVVKYQRGVGPVSEMLKQVRRKKWLENHPSFANKGELRQLHRSIEQSRRELKSHRQHVAQSKFSSRSAGTKGRVETNIRPNNPAGLAAQGRDGGPPGNGRAFAQLSAAAPSLQTGCELTPKGCLHAEGGQTAVELKSSE